ncbi:MAG: beta-galactosidase [bacterium]|nr:beta-galactosidase [bacterium]
MFFGADYYPEQWDISLIDEDMQRMQKLGFNVIRIAEFAWHVFEPIQDCYEFTFFDKVILKAKEYNLKIIMGTPTATIPAWAVKEYPEILSEDEKGHKRHFGGRRQYCFNSGKYIELSQKIVSELINHYSEESQIIGWQIDNEFGHEGSDLCFCDQCCNAFQLFLRDKYFDISKLNDVYGTTFWSQTYNDFSEIPIPKPTITFHNPALMLDFYRFRSDSIYQYAKMQIDIIKTQTDKQFVTHNFSGGLFDKAMDFAKIGFELDTIAYDNYPVWGGLKEPVPSYSTALYLDMMRCIKHQNFWVMEQLIGAQGHQVIGYLPRPDQAVNWACQSVAHGAENIVFFRYRAAVKGSEQFCYGIIDHDNSEGRKYNEVKKFITEMLENEDAGTGHINSEIALLFDMDNIWSWKIQQQSEAFDFTKEAERLYAPFFKLNVPVDVISSDSDFSKYKVLLIPVLMLGDENTLNRINQFAKSGGSVVFSFRAGIKNKDNNIIFNEENLVNKMAGIKICEFESLQSDQNIAVRNLKNNEIYFSGVWRDMLKCITAKPLFNYTDYFYSKYSAVTENSYGDGKVYYIGTGLSIDNLRELSKDILDNKGIKYIESPEGVEIVRRNESYFIMNSTEQETSYNGIRLKPFEYKILKDI